MCRTISARVIGVFDLESDRLAEYSEEDLAVLSLLASHVAIIIDKVRLHEQMVEKKRIEAQLEIARQVQLELLPDHDPELTNFDISAYVFPTEEVSGDYYDWVRIFDDQIGLPAGGLFARRGEVAQHQRAMRDLACGQRRGDPARAQRHRG